MAVKAKWVWIVPKTYYKRRIATLLGFGPRKIGNIILRLLEEKPKLKTCMQIGDEWYYGNTVHSLLRLLQKLVVQQQLFEIVYQYPGKKVRRVYRLKPRESYDKFMAELEKGGAKIILLQAVCPSCKSSGAHRSFCPNRKK